MGMLQDIQARDAIKLVTDGANGATTATYQPHGGGPAVPVAVNWKRDSEIILTDVGPARIEKSSGRAIVINSSSTGILLPQLRERMVIDGVTYTIVRVMLGTLVHKLILEANRDKARITPESMPQR